MVESPAEPLKEDPDSKDPEAVGLGVGSDRSCL